MKYMLNILTNLGGTVNVTDEYLHTANFQEIAAELPPVKLALNCVGGESATDLARLLAPGGTLVTYGTRLLFNFSGTVSHVAVWFVLLCASRRHVEQSRGHTAGASD